MGDLPSRQRTELARLRHQMTVSGDFARARDYRSAWASLSNQVERYLAVAATPEQMELVRIGDILNRMNENLIQLTNVAGRQP